MIEQFFKIDPRLLDIADAALGDCRAPFDRIDETAEYNACKVLDAKDEVLSAQRLALVQATRITLKNALTLIGVEAPEKM